MNKTEIVYIHYKLNRLIDENYWWMIKEEREKIKKTIEVLKKLIEEKRSNWSGC